MHLHKFYEHRLMQSLACGTEGLNANGGACMHGIQNLVHAGNIIAQLNASGKWSCSRCQLKDIHHAN